MLISDELSEIVDIDIIDCGLSAFPSFHLFLETSHSHLLSSQIFLLCLSSQILFHDLIGGKLDLVANDQVARMLDSEIVVSPLEPWLDVLGLT